MRFLDVLEIHILAPFPWRERFPQRQWEWLLPETIPEFTSPDVSGQDKSCAFR
ncbi:MAG: hypothetical protein WBL50_06800 [Candidatus Acidiferrum sp.]